MSKIVVKQSDSSAHHRKNSEINRKILYVRPSSAQSSEKRKRLEDSHKKKVLERNNTDNVRTFSHISTNSLMITLASEDFPFS